MDHAAKGATALAASDASTAVSEYTQALIEHPTSPDYFIQRSTAFTRLKPARHDMALQDAEYAVLLGQKRAKREKIQAAQQRRVVSLHLLNQPANARFILDTMERWRPKNSKKDKMEGDMWKAKVDSKLKDVAEADRQVTIKEYPDIELPDAESMKRLLKAQLKHDGTFKFDEEPDTKVDEAAVLTTEAISKASEQTTTSPSVPSQPGPKVADPQNLPAIRHEWYQNTQSVVITLYAKAVAKDQLEVDLEEDSLLVSFPHPASPSSTFTYALDPFEALVVPAESNWKAMSTKIEISLKKAMAGQKWKALEGTEKLKKSQSKDTSTEPAKAAIMQSLAHNANPVQQTTAAPSYPTSSRSGPKNWDKLASDLTAKPPKSKKGKEKAVENTSEPEDEDQDEFDSDTGGDAVDGFFKKLYKGADDDTRRAMMKSFQESGGTSLSTNWSEVSKGRVEPVKSKDED